MGIAGLLQFISSAKEHTRVSRFKGHRVGVDASGWMHRSLSTCARELALGIETDKHIKYCLSLVRALRRDGVEPLLVFDGAPIAQKALTNSQRGDVRKAAKREVEAKRSAGEDAEADKLCRKSIGVPAEMVQQLIVALRAEGVAFLVAPYEADAQLAFLARTGQVAAVISEDSDLLAFGAPRVLFKFDLSGSCEMVSLDDLKCAEDERHGGHLFAGLWAGEWDEWRNRLFVDMCILAGCDYLQSLPGVGIRTAHALLRVHRSVEAVVAERVGSAGGLGAEYLRRFELAREVFRHQLVWDGSAVAPLTPLPAGFNIETAPHLGFLLSRPLGRAVCVEATVDARTLEQVAGSGASAGGAAVDGRAPRTAPPAPGATAAASAAARALVPRGAFKRERHGEHEAAAVVVPQWGDDVAVKAGRRVDDDDGEAGAAGGSERARRESTSSSRYFKTEAAALEAAGGSALHMGEAAGSARAHPHVKAGPSARTTPRPDEARPPPAVVAPLSFHAQPGGGSRLGFAPKSPPAVDRAVLAVIDRICPASAERKPRST